jgi:hypothetical protein
VSPRVEIAFGMTLCRETVRALAAAHIALYADRIELKSRGVMLDECAHYREVWVSIRTAMARGTELGTEERHELYDAVTSGDHDMLLTPDEFAMVHRVGRAS